MAGTPGAPISIEGLSTMMVCGWLHSSPHLLMRLSGSRISGQDKKPKSPHSLRDLGGNRDYNQVQCQGKTLEKNQAGSTKARGVAHRFMQYQADKVIMSRELDMVYCFIGNMLVLFVSTPCPNKLVQP